MEALRNVINQAFVEATTGRFDIKDVLVNKLSAFFSKQTTDAYCRGYQDCQRDNE